MKQSPLLSRRLPSGLRKLSVSMLLLVCIGVSLLISSCPALSAAGAAPVRLVVAGKVDPNATVVWQDEEALVRAGDVLAPLGLKVEKEARSGRVTFRLPDGRQAFLTVGGSTVKVGDDEVSLGLPVMAARDDIMVSLKPFARAIGLVARWDEDRKNVVVSPRLDGVQVIHEKNAVRFRFAGTYPLRGEVQRLFKPQRIFLDVRHAVLMGQARELAIGRKPVAGARLSQNWLDPDVVRLVVDLEAGTEYSISEVKGVLDLTIHCAPRAGEGGPPATGEGASSQPGPAEQAQLERIDFERVSDRIMRVRVRSSNPVKYSVSMLPNPDRLILDFQDTVKSAGVHKSYAVNQAGVERIRVSQFQLKPPAVRMVLDLDGPRGYRSYEDPEDPSSVIVEVGHTLFSNRVIVLDPGHGAKDPGAPGPDGMRESHIVLDIAHRLNKLLLAAGAQVYMTRRDDTFIPLEGRVEYAASVNADIFVSIHANAMPGRQATGVETYYRTPQSSGLAQALHKSMVQGLGASDRKVRQANFHVIRNCRMPSVLVETGFISTPADAALLANPDYRQRIAGCLFKGLENYLVDSGQCQVDNPVEVPSLPED